MRYHLLSVRMAMWDIYQETKFGEGIGKMEYYYTVGGNLNLFSYCETIIEGSKKIKYKTAMWFWRRNWQLTPVFLPGGSQRQRVLASYSPQGCKQSDTTEAIYHHMIQQSYFCSYIQEWEIRNLKTYRYSYVHCSIIHKAKTYKKLNCPLVDE